MIVKTHQFEMKNVESSIHLLIYSINNEDIICTLIQHYIESTIVHRQDITSS